MGLFVRKSGVIMTHRFLFFDTSVVFFCVRIHSMTTIRGAVQLLTRNKFHETFQAINDHFINLGISNIARFEHEARAYMLKIGQDVQHHIENLREAIKRWMMMELLEHEMELIHSPLCPRL